MKLYILTLLAAYIVFPALVVIAIWQIGGWQVAALAAAVSIYLFILGGALGAAHERNS
jgi:hypothetical protein